MVLLCDRGLAVCESLGIKSAHLKRSSNSPHIAANVTHPETGKRLSVALWKIVTTRAEAGWSVEYLNRNVCDLRLENLKTIPPPDAEPEDDTETIAEEEVAAMSPEVEQKIQRQRKVFEDLTSDQQKKFYKILCLVASKRMKKYNLTEDVVSEIFADRVWPRIVSGKCNHETFEGMLAFAAQIVDFHANTYAKSAVSGCWGDSVPDRPRLMAKHGIKMLEYIPDVTDAAYAQENGLLPARPTRVGNADEQWERTFGKEAGSLFASERDSSYRFGKDQDATPATQLDSRDL